MKKLMLLCASLALVFALAGCATNGGVPKGSGSIFDYAMSGVLPSYTDYLKKGRKFRVGCPYPADEVIAKKGWTKHCIVGPASDDSAYKIEYLEDDATVIAATVNISGRTDDLFLGKYVGKPKDALLRDFPLGENDTEKGFVIFYESDDFLISFLLEDGNIKSIRIQRKNAVSKRLAQEADSVKPSPILSRKGITLDGENWVRTQICDEQTKEPIANLKCVIYVLQGDNTGEIITRTDENGWLFVEHIPDNDGCYIDFYGADDSDREDEFDDEEEETDPYADFPETLPPLTHEQLEKLLSLIVMHEEHIIARGESSEPVSAETFAYLHAHGNTLLVSANEEMPYYYLRVKNPEPENGTPNFIEVFYGSPTRKNMAFFTKGKKQFDFNYDESDLDFDGDKVTEVYDIWKQDLEGYSATWHTNVQIAGQSYEVLFNDINELIDDEDLDVDYGMYDDEDDYDWFDEEDEMEQLQAPPVEFGKEECATLTKMLEEFFPLYIAGDERWKDFVPEIPKLVTTKASHALVSTKEDLISEMEEARKIYSLIEDFSLTVYPFDALLPLGSYCYWLDVAFSGRNALTGERVTAEETQDQMTVAYYQGKWWVVELPM